MAERTATRIIFEFDNGEAKVLSGKQAKNWLGKFYELIRLKPVIDWRVFKWDTMAISEVDRRWQDTESMKTELEQRQRELYEIEQAIKDKKKKIAEQKSELEQKEEVLSQKERVLEEQQKEEQRRLLEEKKKELLFDPFGEEL